MSRLRSRLAGFVLLAGACALPGRAAEDERPNIVLIISDDQAYHDFSFMGHPTIKTPHLDRLASQSLTFTRGYVTTALCCPSLGTMLTGAYPHEHGYTGNDPVGGGDKRPYWVEHFGALPQMPRLLSEAGYLTLHTGKYWWGHPVEVSGFTDCMNDDTGRHGSRESLAIGRDTMQPIYDFIAKARKAQKPFMVWYAPFLPHTPHTPPERLMKKWRGVTTREGHDTYHAMVDWLDETCGELLDYLDDQGLRDNTIVLFVIDNGWPQGDELGGGYRGHVSKLTPWEQGVRTPVMIRWPGKVAPERNDVDLVSNIDIPVTILAAAGVSVPEVMPGLSLLDREAITKRDTVFIEDFAHDMTAPDRPEETLEARGVISGEWKLVENYIEEQGEQPGTYLFHVTEDPKEKQNLAGQRPEKVRELKQKLDAWWNPPLNAATAPSARQEASLAGNPVTERFVFKTVDGISLHMKIWYPPLRDKYSPNLPAAVMFFGGGWFRGDVGQFDGIGAALARRGMIVVAPEYRTRQCGGATPAQCLEDSKSAMRYVYSHADELGIDKNRIITGGRSAGGHLAAAVGFSKGFNAPDDDLSVPTMPKAMILYNPTIDSGPGGFRHNDVRSCWQDFSPLHTVTTNPPPTLFLTGDQDQHTPIETARKFKVEMERQGGRCELVVFEGGKHGSPFAPEHYPRTEKSVDDFLVGLGYLEPRYD